MSAKREDIDDFEVWFKYNVEGWTQKEIADYYRVSRSTIYSRLHPGKNRETSARFRLDHPEKAKEHTKKWQKENREYENERKIQWFLKHPEYRKGWIKTWRESDDGKLYMKEYRQSGKGIATLKRWQQTEKFKEGKRKINAIRRDLGFIPLNEPFDDCEFHHYDKEHGIYMPANIHQSIYHNVWTGEGMQVINKEAFEFLEWEMIDKQWEALEGGRGVY